MCCMKHMQKMKENKMAFFDRVLVLHKLRSFSQQSYSYVRRRSHGRLDQVSSRFHTEYIRIIVSNRNVGSRTKSDGTFHN